MSMDLLLCILSVIIIILLLVIVGAVKKLSGRSNTGSASYSAPASVQAPMAAGGVTPEVMAAIVAAIASVWDGNSGFTVRHVKRIQNSPAWNRAGREEQIFNRI